MNARKLIVFALLAILLLSTFACGGDGEEVTLEPGAYLIYEVDSENVVDATPAEALEEMEEIIKERIYTYALGQPVVIEHIDDVRISIFLPDVTDIEEAREMVGNTEQFNLRELINGQWVLAEVMGPGEEIMPLTGVYLLKCDLSYRLRSEEWTCHADLDVRFSQAGAALLGPFTQRHIGETVGIFIGDDAILQVQITERAKDVLEITPLVCWFADDLAEMIDQAALPLSLHYIGGYVYPHATEPSEEPTPTPAAMPVLGYLSYTDEANGFSIWYCQDWYLKEEPDLMLNLVSPRSHLGEQMWGGWWGATVSVSKDYTRETVLWNAFNEWKAVKKELQAYTQIYEEQVTVGGLSAIRHVFEYKRPNAWITVEELFSVKDGVAYVVTCSASTSLRDEYESIFDTVINSFRLLD